jgi:di/tricarboxylate transporter
MAWEAILTLCVLAGTITLFATEKLPVDIVAVLALSALVILGLVTPDVAISGFANDATITVAAMFVLSAGLQRTGALSSIGRLFARAKRPWTFVSLVMLAVIPISAFVNNTAAVAVFLPLVLAATARNGVSPSKVLIPLSYAAQMGGVWTLVGTSTNLLVNSLAKNLGHPGFSLFEFLYLGMACTVAGVVYLLTVGRWLLPDRRPADLSEIYELGKYITELRVMPKSPLIGTSVADARLRERFGVFVLELLRGSEKVWSPRSETLAEGDILLIRGEWNKLTALKEEARLELEPEFKLRDSQFEVGDQALAEVMVAPGSRFDGQTIKSLDFQWHYNATVLALHRRGEILREKLSEVTLNVGDILLLLTRRQEVRALRNNPNLVVITEREEPSAARRRAPVAVGIMVAVIAASAFGLMPIVISALIGSVAMVLTRCLAPEEAYGAIDWRVIVLIAGVLPLGIALQQSGAAEFLAANTLGRVGDYGPVVVLAMMYLLALVLSELMSNAAAAVLLVPIAFSTATALGLSPTPFLVAVTFAASTSFSTPVGYQTNTMVYNIGNYRFVDFMRVGIPLNLIFWVVGIFLIPMIWPFHL